MLLLDSPLSVSVGHGLAKEIQLLLFVLVVGAKREQTKMENL